MSRCTSRMQPSRGTRFGNPDSRAACVTCVRGQGKPDVSTGEESAARMVGTVIMQQRSSRFSTLRCEAVSAPPDKRKQVVPFRRCPIARACAAVQLSKCGIEDELSSMAVQACASTPRLCISNFPLGDGRCFDAAGLSWAGLYAHAKNQLNATWVATCPGVVSIPAQQERLTVVASTCLGLHQSVSRQPLTDYVDPSKGRLVL